jgi:hypothetical protein
VRVRIKVEKSTNIFHNMQYLLQLNARIIINNRLLSHWSCTTFSLCSYSGILPLANDHLQKNVVHISCNC